MNCIKKILFSIVAVCLLMASANITEVLASTLSVKNNKTLTSKFNVYDEVVVGKGATLKLADRVGEPVGIEIKKKLVVKNGGKITGNGLLIFGRKAYSEGIDLYYIHDGKYKILPGGMSPKVAADNAADYRPEFRYDSKVKGYVLQGELKGGDPFAPELNVCEANVCVGETFKLSLSDLKKDVKWSSSDKTIAKVSAKGVVTAITTGTVTITAKYAGEKYTCTIYSVEKGLSPQTLYMNTGEEFSIQLNGYKVKSVKSSDTSIATVSKKKLKVSAKGSGTCTIIVKATDGSEHTCEVVVV